MPAYNCGVIHELLTKAFSTGEINTLAFDLFPEQYDDFAGEMSKRDRIERIVSAAEKKGRLPSLVAYVQKHNPYRYNQYAARLLEETTTKPHAQTSTPRAGWQQRVDDLREHLETDTNLLKELEDLLRSETHPNRRYGLKKDIERQKEALAGWQSELATLEGEIVQAEPDDDVGQQILSEVRALKQQIILQHDEVAENLATLTVGQQQILERIDTRHRETITAVLQRLDDNQYELVGHLLDAAEKQQISYQQAMDLTQLTQQAVDSLARQPDERYWQEIKAAVEEPASLQQKLKLVLPIIPTILEYEAEFAVDGLGWLKGAWQSVVGRYGRS